MKSVTIGNQSCWGSFEEINAEKGFTISCIDEEKKASIFDSPNFFLYITVTRDILLTVII